MTVFICNLTNCQMKEIAVMGKGDLYIRIVLFTRGDGNCIVS